MIVLIVTFLMAYLIGSIPTAVWVGRAWFGIDVREHGSKNAGATNTFRVLGKKSGVFVLLIDVLKGVFAVVLPMMIWHEGALVYGITSDRIQILAAIAAVVGHIFPVFAGFRGGKGVATSLGVMIGILPLSAAVCLGIFITVFILSKYVSFSAICAAFCFPFSVLFLEPQREEMFYFSVVLSLAVIWAHKKNIRRLLKGEENKMNLFA